MANIKGFLTYQGKVIAEPEKKSFLDLSIGDNSNLVLACATGSEGEQLKWCRFPSMVFTDYYHLSCNYADAVAFIPKKPIVFHGFGIL